MAYVGQGTPGKVLTAHAPSGRSKWLDIGTESTLTDHGVILGQGVNAFVATGPGAIGQVLTSNGAAADPTFQAASASGAITTVTGNSGGPESPLAGNFNVLGTGSITTVGTANTETIQLTGLTNHAVLIGAGSATITNVGPVASTGAVLMSNGVGNDPGFSTATYPLTTTVSQILYSSATNTVAGLATANSAALVTTAAGVPVFSGTMTDGQMIIGDTSGTPVAGTITSTGGSVTVTTGAGTLNLEVAAAAQPFGVENIGIAYGSPTFTVHGYDGSTMTASNPGKAWVQSKATPGRLVQLSATENFTFTDGSTGTTDNQRFGLTTGVNWDNTIPFFLYMIAHDTPASAPAFGISRNPCATVAPAAASIGVSGSVVNVGQGDFFLLTGATSGIPTVGNYDTNPCVCIGAFRMSFVGATDHWVVTTLTNSDGVGQFHEATDFTLPAGVNGAAASTFWVSNAGTEPQFTTQVARYHISRDGFVDYRFSGTNCNVAGVGVNALQPILPYAAAMDSGDTAQLTGYYNDDSVAQTYYGLLGGIDQTNLFITFLGIATSAGVFINTSFAANDDVYWSIRYPAYRIN